MPTPSGFPTSQDLINAQKDVEHLGRVVNSEDAQGNYIASSTNRTGGTNKTLDALQAEYQSAIQSAGGVPLGTWSAGITINAYNEYMVYNGIPYKPAPSTPLPYTTQGSDPTVAPDVGLVVPFAEVQASDLVTVREDLLGPGTQLYMGDDGESVKVGDTIPEGTTHLRYNDSLLALWSAVSVGGSVDSISPNDFTGYNVTLSATVYEFVDLKVLAQRRVGNPAGFGAVAGVNSTTQIQKCIDELGFIKLTHESSPWVWGSITTTRQTAFLTNGETVNVQTFDDSTYNPFVSIAHDSSYWSELIKIDSNGTSKIPVQVNGGVANVECHVRFENLNADAGAKNYTGGLVGFNAPNLTFSVVGRNVSNTGHPNESIPRVVSIQDGATTFTAGLIKGIDCEGSTFLVNNAVGSVDKLETKNCGDNGVYAGGSSDVHVSSMLYQGSEEAVVSIANSSVKIDTLTVTGQGGYCVNAADNKSIDIGILIVGFDSDGGSPAGIARTRTSNTAAGPIRIGTIMGEMAGERLFAFDTGTLSNFVISDMDFNFHYDASRITGLAFFARFEACREIHIGRMNLNIVSDYFSSVKIFELKGLDNLVNYSDFNNLFVKFTTPDGSPEPFGNFRGYLANEFLIGRNGLGWRTSIGPFVREADDAWCDGIITGDVPTSGYWYAGTDLALRERTVSPFRARCTVSGTPGTWVKY